MVQVTTPTSLGVDSPQGRKLFIFDRVFAEDTTQKGIWDYLQDSVESFLQGYNVSILAYGQSGSGKSHTMGTSGPQEQRDPTTMGVIPRAAQHMFDSLGGRPTHSRSNSGLTGLKAPNRYSVSSLNQVLQAKNASSQEWEMTVTYVEIYNEQPRDLLLPEATPLHERPNVQIREDPRGRIFVEGLKSVRVSSMEELMGVLNHGSTIRQTDATAINARSSRSHAVFTINLRRSKPQTVQAVPRDKRASMPVDGLMSADGAMMTVESKLHFVDLAGSERLKNTQATGDRAKEGISINAGLASLGKVISQLSTRSAGMHVSYRDSKLTRMLQDSLGGNAITYMIACVTPAEFHLSETLNTVQYAQRARSIQSKPKIQQINDDSDKQAVIDRLRSEVAFLRQQIRSAEGGERRPNAVLERMDRSSERESDLQNQLLDVQESYTTLSQRHAKLISELARSGEDVTEVSSVAGESAMSRLKRSQVQQQQIEQMVLEYEKTIQTLEANLSNTRSHLSTTESSLLERETKCAYVETMNHQLNTRVQKLMDRESNMEQYVHDLEARLEDQSSGSEKNDAILGDLRKEIARIRESEGNAEDYICTLEERLAEADQDMEIMQREVERLEHLVERQRSLGKLDNLLYELDHIQRKDSKAQQAGVKTRTEPATNGFHSPNLSALPEGAEDVELPEEDQEDLDESEAQDSQVPEIDEAQTDLEGLEQLEKATALSPPHSSHRDAPLASPAQERFVAEKMESLSHELFDLRVEHEGTVNQLELMSAKYQEALRALAELQQDRIDEARHGPQQSETENSPMPDAHPATFLEDARNQDSRNGGHLSSSRSLSSELSLAGESHTSTDTDITPVSKQQPSGEVATREIERLQTLLADHEREKSAVEEQYSQLQAEHKDALSTVEKLRTEVTRATRPGSPSPNVVPPGVLRRMTSQLNSGVDRGQRSIVSLRTMLAEELDGKSDRLEAAEVHLSSATHELQSRKDRIDALEAEVKNAKKEMEMKTTIISGLTRERNSMKAGSPVDLSMVSQMRDQLIQKETELKSLHESYYRREQELRDEVRNLSAERSRQPTPSMPQESTETQDRLKNLESQLQDITEKHESARNLADESARQLAVTKSELNAALANVETIKASNRGIDGASPEPDAAASAFRQERENYEQLINELKNALDEQQSLTTSQKEKIAELVELHSQMTRDATALSKQLKSSEAEVAKVRPRLSDLETELKETKSAVEFHKHGLKSLHDAHANEVEEMKLSHAGQLASYDDTIAELTRKLDKLSKSYSTDVSGSRGILDDIVRDAQKALGHPTTADMLANHIQDLAEEKMAIAATVKRLQGTNTELERQLTGRQNLQELEAEVEGLNTKMANYQDTIRNLANEVGNHEETIRERDTVIKKHEATIESLSDEKAKKVNLIEELEQQLQNSFDQHHNRVSVIQAAGNQALVEAQQRIALLEKDLGETQRRSYNDSDQGSRTNTMKSQRPQSPPTTDSQQRSNSLSSNLRKSASIASLPSPPPAIPLPPLPTLPGIQSAAASNPSPPQSRHTSKEVTLPAGQQAASRERDSASAEKLKRQSALIEEQEGRIRTIEKHLHAEKQLTATLEEALVDLETQSNKLRADAEGWKKKAWAMEEEITGLKKEKKSERLSVQAVEEEVKKRREAEAARAQLEERMRLLTVGDGKKKKKGGGLNCF
jgi:chromosome segregation ATPase